MSYSHNQRKKRIKHFKKEYGKKWYSHFREFVKELEKKSLGKPVGTVEDLFMTEL